MATLMNGDPTSGKRPGPGRPPGSPNKPKDPPPGDPKPRGGGR